MTADPPTADPMPAAALGAWLSVAAEAMFFAGLLSAYLVLQSTPAEHARFVRSAAVVSRPLTAAAAALLAASAAVRWRRPRRLGGAAALAVAFLAVQAWADHRLLAHRTVVTAAAVFDGHVADTPTGPSVTGVREPLPPSLDLSRTTPDDVRGPAGTYAVPATDVRADASYGPSRNNYFGCYFLVTGAVVVHVGGSLIALAWLGVRRRSPAATRAVTLFWQFGNAVGVASLVLLSAG